MKFLFIFLTFLAIDCSDKNIIANQDLEKKTLEKLAMEIKSLAEESICSESYFCDYVGFGSKPCGGNWEYLIYSSSIDTKDFLSKVKKYNDLEKEFNTKYDIVSDCMFVTPPVKVLCENGKCKAIY